MNIIQIEAGLAGKDDLPYVDVHIGEHITLNFEVLKPRLSRWHWWRDEHRHTTEHTIMVPILSLQTKRWGEDRGNGFTAKTVVVPKHIAEMAPVYFRTILTKFTVAEDVFGPVSLTSTCRHCERRIVMEDGRWVDPEATGDDSVWRETCDRHDTFTAEHEPTLVETN